MIFDRTEKLEETKKIELNKRDRKKKNLRSNLFNF